MKCFTVYSAKHNWSKMEKPPVQIHYNFQVVKTLEKSLEYVNKLSQQVFFPNTDAFCWCFHWPTKSDVLSKTFCSHFSCIVFSLGAILRLIFFFFKQVSIRKNTDLPLSVLSTSSKSSQNPIYVPEGKPRCQKLRKRKRKKINLVSTVILVLLINVTPVGYISQKISASRPLHL